MRVLLLTEIDQLFLLFLFFMLSYPAANCSFRYKGGSNILIFLLAKDKKIFILLTTEEVPQRVGIYLMLPGLFVDLW